MKFVIFLNKTHHMNEQTIQLSLFVVFYLKFVAFLPLITIKSSLILLDSKLSFKSLQCHSLPAC